jgi:hypothetical protein
VSSSRIPPEQAQLEATMAVAAMTAALAGHTTLFIDQPLDSAVHYRANGDTTIMMQCSPQLQERRITTTDSMSTSRDHGEVQHRCQDDVELREPSALFQAAQRLVLGECSCLRNVHRTQVGFQAELGPWVHQQTQTTGLQGLVESIQSRVRCLEVLDACLLIELGRQRGDHVMWKVPATRLA